MLYVTEKILKQLKYFVKPFHIFNNQVYGLSRFYEAFIYLQRNNVIKHKIYRASYINYNSLVARQIKRRKLFPCTMYFHFTLTE